MIQPSGEFLAFGEEDFYRVTGGLRDKVRAHIESISESDLRQADQDALAEQIIQRFTLAAPSLDFDHIQKTGSERLVEDYSGFGAVMASATGGSRQVRRQVVTYHIPVKGDTTLLRYRPSSFSFSAPRVYLQGSQNDRELCFDVVRQSNNPSDAQRDLEWVRGEAERNINQLRTLSERQVEDASKFNDQMRAEVPQLIAARKQRLQGNDDFLSQL